MEQQQYKTIDKYDRQMGSMIGRPDVVKTAPSTINTVIPLTGEAQTFIVQTFREKERGDWIFVVYVDGDKSIRLAIPPAAADAIARQRDALTGKNRSLAARAKAAARKAGGEKPGFQMTPTERANRKAERERKKAKE